MEHEIHAADRSTPAFKNTYVTSNTDMANPVSPSTYWKTGTLSA